MSATHARVLIVEESPAEALLIQEALAEPGSVRFDVDIAERVAAARERLATEGFDAVVFDLSAPGGKGLAGFAALREAAGDTPIVVLTGPEDEDLALGALWAGAQDYLCKGSVQPQEPLARSLRHALEHHEDQRKLVEQAQLLGERDSQLATYQRQTFHSAPTLGFDRLPERRSPERVRLGKELPRALEQGRFSLAYQPIVRLSDGALTGFESLLRCADPVRGMVPPAELIPVAEETGMIVPLTAWVLAESCWRLADWLTVRGTDGPDFAMHVNLSHSCLAEPRLAARLHAALDANGIPGSRLVVELTESACADPVCARRVLQQIREMGVRVALDDFGTGYNSLGSLQQLPVDMLKIDRSFVSRLGTGESPEVLRAIFSLAERLGLEVIAEGVETIAQLAELRALGCDLAQGFLFAAPCEPEVARELTRGALGWPF
jgi:EAL domain-containing protein (putative c-di-GMP-specific phosphodiesterase class I)/DNA-binding NarL/FixJ family response regulator